MRRRIYLLLWGIILVSLFSVCSNEQRLSSENFKKEGENQLEFPGSKISFGDLFEEVNKVPLHDDPGFELSPWPSIGAINKEGNFIILDNFARNILVFNRTGRGKEKIGSQGRGEAQYLYPECMFYQKHLGKYYVYDADRLRILLFDEEFRYSFSFDIPLYLEGLSVTDDGRIFCYTSGAASARGADRVVYECDKNGKILNKFCKMSKNYSPPGESKGGGIVIAGSNLYVITPYEYTIKKFDLDGKMIKEVQGKSTQYIPPKKLTNDDLDEMRRDFQKIKEYHRSWSHIGQILRIGKQMIGIVVFMATPEPQTFFLDLYDLDLNRISGDIALPEFKETIHRLYT
ncbi:MAG: 6-bladed beta-propeller, partial [Acidobacteriota bacterium]|nr:6-bladed beta-propeller [Acidobacteriota bacterium]